MSRYSDREEAFRIAAEKMREKREKEEREDREFYERITSGFPWFIFKSVVVFCTLLALVTTYDYFVDGPSKKLSENDWKIDRNWEWTWHKILDVKGYMFAPESGNWSDRIENSLELTYTPIFQTGKKLSYSMNVDKVGIVRQVEIRQRSIFTWFPAFQVFLLIPLITFIL